MDDMEPWEAIGWAGYAAQFDEDSARASRSTERRFKRVPRLQRSKRTGDTAGETYVYRVRRRGGAKREWTCGTCGKRFTTEYRKNMHRKHRDAITETVIPYTLGHKRRDP